MDKGKKRKFVVLGHRGVGKTSLIMSFVDNTYVENYYPTIESIHWKAVKYNDVLYNFEIVDTAGQDEFSILNSQYTVGVDGYVLVFSVTSRLSFDMLGSIHDKILDATGVESIPMVLVGSKNDLSTQRQVSEKEATALSKTFKCSYVECSAKNKTNIDKIFQMAVSDLDKFNNPSAETGDDQQKAATCTLM